jgi:hypothetical protein
MQRRIFIGEGVGYLLVALGIGAFQSVTTANLALAMLFVGPFAFLGGACTSFLPNKDPWLRTARGAFGLFVFWASFWALVMLFLPRVSPSSWQDWLTAAGISTLVISGSALGIAWRLQRDTASR